MQMNGRPGGIASQIPRPRADAIRWLLVVDSMRGLAGDYRQDLGADFQWHQAVVNTWGPVVANTQGQVVESL